MTFALPLEHAPTSFPPHSRPSPPTTWGFRAVCQASQLHRLVGHSPSGAQRRGERSQLLHPHHKIASRCAQGPSLSRCCRGGLGGDRRGRRVTRLQRVPPARAVAGNSPNSYHRALLQNPALEYEHRQCAWARTRKRSQRTFTLFSPRLNTIMQLQLQLMMPARHGPASPESERDCPQSRALVVRCEHRAGEQPSAEALETLREWALAHGCGGLEAGWRATTQTRHHDGPTSGQVDRYYYSPSGETIGPTALMPPTESLIVILRLLLTASGERLRSRLEVGRSAAPRRTTAPLHLITLSAPPSHHWYHLRTPCTAASPHHPLSPRAPSLRRWLGLDCGGSVGWKRQKLGPVCAQLSVAGGGVALRLGVSLP